MRRIWLLMISVAASGCATIMNGETQRIWITSTPTGSTYSIDGDEGGVTPAAATVSREHDHVISVKAVGYKQQDFPLTHRVSGWLWGNLILMPLAPIGAIIDLATGAAYKMKPAEVAADLSRDDVDK